MPIVLNDNRYTETRKTDGSILRVDRELSIVTGRIHSLKNQYDQADGIYTWNRGELEFPSNIISDNFHLSSYLRNHNLKFTLKTKMKLKEGDTLTLLGHINQFIFASGAYSLTLDSSTAVSDTFTYDTIRQILLTNKVKESDVDALIQSYQQHNMQPIQVITDIKRGDKSFHLVNFNEDVQKRIMHAMDTQDDNLAEAIVKAELLPYFNNNNSFAKQMYQLYGFDALNKLKEDPWALTFDVSRLTLTHCDNIATILGYDIATDPRRTRVIVRLAFNKTIKESNYTYIPQDQIDTLYQTHLQQFITYDEFEEILTQDLVDQIVKTRIGYQPRNLYHGEYNIYKGYEKLNQFSHKPLSDTHFNQILSEIQADKPNFQFAELQEKAVRESVEHDLFILTGGPGTGKTTTLSSILRAHQLHFNYPAITPDVRPIMLLAPTGKAATRMIEQTGLYASTIHKQLMIVSDGCRDIKYVLDQFEKFDTRLIVIDEASMLDTVIAGTIFQIIRQSKRQLKLIIVGDQNQLPSINPGQILKDLLKYHKHVVTLTEVKRQADGSNIPDLAYMISQGYFPEKEWFKDKDDIHLIESTDSKHMLQQTRTMLYRRQQFNDLEEFQILTPYVNQSRQAKLNQSIIDYDTCDMINHHTQQFFNNPYYDPTKTNPDELKRLLDIGVNDGKTDSNIKRFINNGSKINGVRHEGRLFRVGDRVVCNRNLSESVANGSIGTLRQIGTHGSDDIKDWILMVEFEGSGDIREFEFQNWSDIDLAYAITIHKSQGSEYTNVFLTITRQPRPNDSFLNRNIIYTAVTRTKEKLVLMGRHQDFVQATFNEQKERKTGLAEMLRVKKTLRQL